MELALWIRSSTSDMSFWILFFEAESLGKWRTFCWKLLTATMDVADIVAVWASLAANAFNQGELLEISESGTSVTAVDCGGRSIRGEEEWRSQRLGMEDGIYWVVGNSLVQKFIPIGSVQWEEAICLQYRP